jgi:carbamoylphosphate synthase large subunit
MPKRTDIHSILIIGSGPIVIGQGCEFDYSGVQACRALKEEGYRIVLINSNPATIMTDPEFADATYIEPITPEAVEKILKREKAAGTPVDAVLPTLGGQTGLNTAMACFDRGIFTHYGVQMIGANRDAIHRGEDRQVFKDLMIAIGLNVPRSGVVHNMADARQVLADIGLPLIIRPAFTLGGTGGGIAYNVEEFETIVQRGLDASPVTEVLIEQSVIGYKEYELEVMRDHKDNVVIICSIENIDAMGVHTGDSITVAPIQTLTDKEYQRMRDASIAIIRAVGVETGGSNIQFGVNPDNGEMVVVEMNPRVSRSSALASKATGFPIAKIAAKLAVGYTLDELANDITSVKGKDGQYERYTSACFEPTIDYCVIKIPRWTFEKFPDADETLTTQMKSVGEAMAIGRTFKEALQKGIRSMEVKRFGFGLDKYDKWLNAQKQGSGLEAQGPGMKTDSGQSDKTTQGESLDQEWPIPEDKLQRKLAVPSQGRLYYLRYALKMGWSIERIHSLTNIDPWFLAQMKQLVDFEDELVEIEKTSPRFRDPECENSPKAGEYADLIVRAKALGYSDVQLASVWGDDPKTFRKVRQWFTKPVYKLVDTCAAEFEAATPYYYSTYEQPYTVDGKETSEDEIRLTDRPKIIIIGGGPNRIGQGIEFDYCCVQAAFAMRELGYESVMINSNPETVSTDYDTSDLLFFEPLTHEDILNICERLNGGPFARPEVVYDLGSSNVSVSVDRMEQIRRCVVEHGLGPVAIHGNAGMGTADATAYSEFYHLVTADGRPYTIAFRSSTAAEPRLTEGAKSSHQAESAETSAAQLRERLAAGSGLLKGVIVQFGGQTPLNLAKGLQDAGVPIIGTSVESIDVAGDREQFRELIQKLGLKQPENGIARSVAEARAVARRIGYPVLVRPSFVLGGRAMEIVSDENQLNYYMTHAVEASTVVDAPILVDKFLDAATECDVDCLADYDASTGQGQAIVIGVMEHIEEAGIHSGDSACALPPYSLPPAIVATLKQQTKALAAALRVRGLMNVQYAVKDGEIYIIEVNPRASRTVPFVSKATGVSWAKIAAKVMAGKSLSELGAVEQPDPAHTSVKESVFPFSKFPGVDVILGPEMRSTGEVMGIDRDFPLAFAKSQIAAGSVLPTKGTVFVSVRREDKEAIIPVARILVDLGFSLVATPGTLAVLAQNDVPASLITKLGQGRPNIQDYIKNGKIQLIINTPTKKGPQTDEGKIRGMALMNRIPIVTTLTGASAAARAIAALQKEDWTVRPLQEYFPRAK